MRTGRKRKTAVVRDRSGKSRGEPHVVSAEVRAVRERILEAEGVDTGEALNSLAGFTLGKLLLRHRANKDDPGSISQEQYEAGEAWSKIVHRHAAIMGYRLNIQTPSFIMVGGMSVKSEPDEEQIIAIRRRWSDCYGELMSACRDHGLRVRDVTYGVCVENWPVLQLSEADYGHLRIGLNAIATALKNRS